MSGFQTQPQSNLQSTYTQNNNEIEKDFPLTASTTLLVIMTSTGAKSEAKNLTKSLECRIHCFDVLVSAHRIFQLSYIMFQSALVSNFSLIIYLSVCLLYRFLCFFSFSSTFRIGRQFIAFNFLFFPYVRYANPNLMRSFRTSQLVFSENFLSLQSQNPLFWEKGMQKIWLDLL